MQRVSQKQVISGSVGVSVSVGASGSVPVQAFTSCVQTGQSALRVSAVQRMSQEQVISASAVSCSPSAAKAAPIRGNIVQAQIKMHSSIAAVR